MDKDVTLWIFGLLITGAYLIIAAGIGYAFWMAQKVIALETIIKMVNKQAVEILHSPHTPDFDVLLEKLVKTYEDRHYELSIQEWTQLQAMSQQIKEDEQEPKGTRLLAAMVYAQCYHKLLTFRKVEKKIIL